MLSQSEFLSRDSNILQQPLKPLIKLMPGFPCYLLINLKEYMYLLHRSGKGTKKKNTQGVVSYINF